MTKWITKAVIAAMMTSFLFTAGPAAVMAAGDGQVVRKRTYEETIPNTTDEEIMERKLYEKAGIFEEEIEEGGRKYALEDVFYTVNEITETWKGEEHTIILPDLPEDQLPKVGSEITEHGIKYLIKSIHVTKKTPQIATEEITEDVRYEAGTEIPAEITVTREGENGSYEARLTLAGTDAAGEPETRDIPVVYHDYDAESYDFGGVTVPRNDDRPVIDGIEDQILAGAELDPAEWSITDIRWTGSPYETAGELRRDAAASAARKTTAVTAHYKGTHTVEQPDIVTAEVIGEAVVTDEEKLAGMGRIATVHVMAEGVYEPVKSIVPKALLAGAGILGFAAAIMITLSAAGRKEKKGRKEGQ